MSLEDKFYEVINFQTMFSDKEYIRKLAKDLAAYYLSKKEPINLIATTK